MKRSNILIAILMIAAIISSVMLVGCNTETPNEDTTSFETTEITIETTTEVEQSTDAETEKTTAEDIITSTADTAYEVPTADEESSSISENVTTAEYTETVEETTTAEEITTAEEVTANPEDQPIPILYITTNDGNSMSSLDNYHACTVTLTNCRELFAFENLSAGIRVRGNSTAGCEKKPYRLKFDEKHSMLGLNDNKKCKSWVLMADYFDHSLMRTMTAFNIANTVVDGAAYVSDYTHVEVYINGDYKGVYLLCEQTQINKRRVNINEKEDGYTGFDVGYLLVGQGGRTNEPNTVTFSKTSKEMTDVYGNTMSMGLPAFSLSSGDYTNEQIDYIRRWISAVYTITYEAIYNNKYYTLDNETCALSTKRDFEWANTRAEKQQETIECVMDLTAAVRMYMVDEIVKDLDSSTYNMCVDLSADGAKKLTFCAPWDFDFALGNTRWASLHDPTGLYACSFLSSDGVRENSWYILLYHADWFVELVKARWAEVYQDLLKDAEDIPTLAVQNMAAYNRNFERWHIMGRITMDWHQNTEVVNYTCHYDAAMDLYNWLVTRIKWLNTVWGDGKYTEIEKEYTFVMADGAYTLFKDFKRCAGEMGTTWYTLRATDGNDPYVTFAVEDEVKLDAATYDHIDITYRIPSTNSKSEYYTEIFLVSGGMGGAEGGKSVGFTAIADGKTHTATLDLTGLSFWTGDIHSIRVDFIPSTEDTSDKYLIKEIRFYGAEMILE